MTKKETQKGSTVILTETYEYKTNNGKPTNQVASHITKNAAGTVVSSYTYSYDANGNITGINDGTYATTYQYDSANQLIRENNQRRGTTWTWEYDNAGNILSRTEYAYTTGETLTDPVDTVTYDYDDSAWGDLLTSYDGSAITYDVSGNPLDDGTWEYTWEHGRQLESMSDGTTTWSYTYDADGMRTGKTDGTTSYSYVYNGGQLSQMTVTTVTETADGQTTTETHTVDLTYDASGNPQTMTYDGTTYYYTVNIQGDVTGIVDESGTVLVRYYYQGYGISYYYGVPTNSVGPTLRQINPITYRGYVYDKETKLYYLQSRYYNRTSGRFINADALVATGQGLLGNNMFAYCRNNPVCRVDSLGTDDETCLSSEKLDELFPQLDVAGPVPRSSADVYKGVQTSTSNPLSDITYTEKVYNQQAVGDDHGFPWVVDNYGSYGTLTQEYGGDGKLYYRLTIDGYYNGHDGYYEYMWDVRGVCNHRFFRRSI